MDLSKKKGIHLLSRFRDRNLRVVIFLKCSETARMFRRLILSKQVQLLVILLLYIIADILLNSILRGSRPESFAAHLIMLSDLRLTGSRSYSPSVIRNICLSFVAQRAPPSSRLPLILARHLLIILRPRSYTLISFACVLDFLEPLEASQHFQITCCRL